MAWGKNRRHVSSSASISSRPATGGRGRSRRPPGEPTEQDIARSIQQSAVRVRVALQLSADDALSDLLAQFETKFEARRSHVLTQRRHVRVELLECGLNSWQHLVELQRVLMGLTRPNELKTRTTLRQDKYDEWTLSLTFARASEDALWRFASSLMLRLRSSGVLSKVLLGLRLVVPLESTFGGVEVDQYQWEGQLLCSEVMVTAGDLKEDIQRVFLPPMCETEDPLAALRYPDLVPIVDDMLSGHSDARKPVVVILRGIPGSGKSTLGREIEAICHHRGVAFTVCSADFFFETARGYVFDVKKLGAAHSTCKGDFARALEGDIPRSHGGRRPHQHVVLVDNTSTQKWEYEPYEDIARSHGSRVHIVEMKCSDALMAFRMGQRNSHGVPPDKVVSMFMRWEEDTRAHCFTPQFEYARLTANPLSDGDAGSLTYIGLFLDDESQQKMLSKIPPIHSNKLADHVTLCYRPNKQYTRDAELGASFTIRGVEVVQDGSGQALRVELDERLPLQGKNKIPHITISTKDGVSASYSNDLLESTSAKRTLLDPPIDLTVRIGAALFIQNQRVKTTTPPFAADMISAPKVCTSCVNTDKEREPSQTSAPSRLLIWYANESGIMSDIEEDMTKFLWRTQILHHMGSQVNVRRLLCVQESQLSSSSSLLSSLQDRFFLSSPICFDDLIVIPQSPSFQEFGDVLDKYVVAAGFGPVNKVTLITSVEEPVQWPLRELSHFHDATLSVIRVGHQSNALQSISPLSPSCPTIFSALDLLGVNIQEEVRSAIVDGVDIVANALAHVSGHDDRHAVQRIDTTLPGLNSSVIELCVLLPGKSSSRDIEVLALELSRALENTGGIHHVVRSCIPGRFYFSLGTASSYTPNFCVQTVIQAQNCSSADTTGSTLLQLNFCEHQLKVSREVCDSEAYTSLVSIFRAILLRGCSKLSSSECQLSSLINLISERLVLHYLGNSDDARPTVEDVASGRNIFALYNMLNYLSRLDPEEWIAAFGDSLLALQGNEKAQTKWRQTMENVMQSCMSAIASHRCVGDDLQHASPLNPQDHLRVLASLVNKDITGAVCVPPTRAYVEISSRSTWSPLHSLACCDKLRSAAAMVLPQDDDEANVDSREFFSCAPSLVARRVDVASSSLDLLHQVIKKLHTLEDTDHDSDGAFSDGFAIRRAETDEELVDLNRSS